MHRPRWHLISQRQNKFQLAGQLCHRLGRLNRSCLRNSIIHKMRSAIRASVDILAQAPAAVRVSQLAQRLGFDLPDSLPGDAEELPYLLKRALPAVIESEAQPEHIAFPGRKASHDLDDVLP